MGRPLCNQSSIHYYRKDRAGFIHCQFFIGFSPNLFIQSNNRTRSISPANTPPDKNSQFFGLPLKSGLLSGLCCAILLSLLPAEALGQLPVYTCRPNDAGDGWICESNDGSALPNTADRPDQYNSDNAVLPGAVPPAQEAAPQETELEQSAPIQVTEEPEETAPQSTTNAAPVAVEQVQAIQPVQPSAPVSSFPLDWVPREQMSSEQLAALPDNCCGAFVDPLQELPVPPGDPDSAETQFSSAGFRQISENFVAIDGDVVVQQGSRTIENDQTTSIDRSNNTILMDGNITFRELGLLLQGNSAFIDSDERVNRIEAAQYVLHDYGAHGDAESIVYNSESGMVTIENGMFSRCEPENEFWTLRASSIILDQDNNRGYAEKASIRLGNVPIFYYPGTLPFPLGDARSSGFLPPSVGSTRTGGFDVEVPYYFNLAPHYDATLSPRLLSDRGAMLGAEFRYLASWSMNSLQFTHLAGDDQFDPLTADIPGSDSPPEEDRWFVGVQHNGALGNNWTSFVDYNAVSDDDYFYDLGGTGINVINRTHLNQQGRLDFNGDFLSAGLNIQRLDIIDPFVNTATLTRPYDRLPQLTFQTGTYLPLGFRVSLRGEASVFDRQLDESLLSMEQIENGALVTGQRVNLEPSLGWSVEEPGWFVRTNATYKHLAYSLENQARNTAEDPDFGVGVYSFDSGLIFDRSTRNGGTQTLEPRVFYLYSEYQDQSSLPLFDTSELNFNFMQLFREDRFSGGDRITDADQVSLALTSRILDSNGRERARFSVGQIRYFADRQVSLNSPLQSWIPRYSVSDEKSAIAAEIGLSLGSSWHLSSDVQWNEESEEINEGRFRLRYQRDANHLFNISYRYRTLVNSPFLILPIGIDPRIKQTDVSGIWPISPNWKLLGRWNYDHANDRNLESFAGVEWSNCCATIRLIGREWVDENQLFVPNTEPNRGFFVQITLNGLGDLTGGGLNNLLQTGIWGFRDSENP